MIEFDYSKVQKIIGHTYKSRELLKTAFVHSSYSNEHKAQKSNERLEFLGDSVLSVIVTDYIFNHYRRNEGELSKIRASLVSEKSLSFLFEQLDLEKYIMKGVGLQNQKSTNAMMADAFEAIVGSLYQDGGIDVAREFVLRMFETAFKQIKRAGVPESYKSLLQEKFKKATILYETKPSGEGLDKIYNSRVFINGVMSGIGTSEKKKNAEELAAKNALEKIKKV